MSAEVEEVAEAARAALRDTLASSRPSNVIVDLPALVRVRGRAWLVIVQVRVEVGGPSFGTFVATPIADVGDIEKIKPRLFAALHEEVARQRAYMN